MSISLPSDTANRLATEASAYLRQHAKNPVAWYPWGDEALSAAKREAKPIFLSIGYSACHWCHVMERESFEDDATARLLNERFISIKVDREERPDLDLLYQLSAQLLGRSGGWPLSVFLTPDQRPFFAGTYFPPVPKYGMPSFRDILNATLEAFQKRPDTIADQAGAMTQAIGELMSPQGAKQPPELSPTLLARAAERMAPRFDDANGGFGSRPKFPNTMGLEVLLRSAHRSRDTLCETRARRALDAMRAGGIWDHLGGGFHRYSTDAAWAVPHFEKMLYDNALLSRLYIDASRALNEPSYAAVASDIAAYLAREMRSPRGGFYATQDADSEGEEGKFFVWTPAQITAVLAHDPSALAVAMAHFGVTDTGNFEHSGATVLSSAKSLPAIATSLDCSLSEAYDALGRARSCLFDAREQRPKPFRDEKILACWNGLAIGALAEIGAATGNVATLDMARAAFAHVANALIEEGGVARFTTDDARVARPGFLDDHACLGNAALDLYEATGEPSYAATARGIADVILTHFADPDAAGFFYATAHTAPLVCRVKDLYDQATPSGSSTTALLLLRLGSLLGERYAAPATRYLESIAAQALENPLAFGQTLLALDRLVCGATDIVLVGPVDHPEARAMRRAVMAAYLPNRTLASVDPANALSIAVASELAAGKITAPHHELVAYVCRGRSCSAPIHTASELAALLAT